MRNPLKNRTFAFVMILSSTAAAAITPARAADPFREAVETKAAAVYSPTETRYISTLPESRTKASKRRWKKAWIASWVTPARAADPFREAVETKAAAVYSPTETRLCWKKAWIASWVAFAAVNLLDAHSSAGRRELNPLLRNSDGTFSARKAALIKSALGGGFFAVQWWIARKNPHTNHYKAFTMATGAAAAGLGVVAARNYGVRKIAQQDLTAAAHPYLRSATVTKR